MYDSSTHFYYLGDGYYDPAIGQSFGCQDNGWVDPGEDLCGEDEYDPTGTGPGRAVASLDPLGMVCAAFQPELTGQGRTRDWKVEGRCIGDAGTKGVLTVKVYWERQQGKGWSTRHLMGACFDLSVSAGEYFSCSGKKYYFRLAGTYQLCVGLESPHAHVNIEPYGCGRRKFRIG